MPRGADNTSHAFREACGRSLPSERREYLQANDVSTLDHAAKAHIVATLRRTNGFVGGRDGAAARFGLKRTRSYLG